MRVVFLPRIQDTSGEQSLTLLWTTRFEQASSQHRIGLPTKNINQAHKRPADKLESSQRYNMAAPANKFRTYALTGSFAAITATGAWYGAGLKERKEFKQVRRSLRLDETPLIKY